MSFSFISILWRFFIDFIVSSITVSVFNPNTSSLISPMSAASSISTATTGILSFVPGANLVSIGAYLKIESFAVTTPAACIPVPRIRPRSCSPYLTTSGYFILNHWALLLLVKSSQSSTFFNTLFTSDNGTLNALDTSLTIPLPLNSKNVAMDATFLYSSSKYPFNSSRLESAISESISGKSFLSGLTNLKNRSPYLIGSTSVIPSA